MDRNSIIGFSLIILILAGYFWYTQPSAEQQARLKKVQDSIAQVKATEAKKKAEEAPKPDTVASAVNEKDTSKMQDLYGGFSKQFGGEDRTFTLSNKHLTVFLSSKGGRIASVKLNEFKRSDSSELVLFTAQRSAFFYEFMMRNSVVRTDEFNWIAEQSNKESITFKLNNGKGGYIAQTYTLGKSDYTVSYKLTLNGVQNDFLRNKPDLKLTWTASIPKQEMLQKREFENSTVYYKIKGEDPDKISETSAEEEKLKAPLEWVSFKQQYFNSTLISKDAFDKDAALNWSETKVANHVKDMKAEVYLPYDLSENRTFDMTWFFGPNHFQTLKKAEVGVDEPMLQKLVPLGWGIFGWVNRYIVIPVFNFLDDYISNYGIIILLLTIIIKLLLLPLVYKSYISTAKMRILKPELDVLKEKYGSDMQKLQVENMALYKKAGVSPLSGCIPLLLQMPILFAMFSFFPTSFELRQKAFLWATDLSRYDSVLDLPFTIPFYGDHVSLFTLLMTISTLIYTRLNNQITGVTGQMKWIGYIMPFIFMGVLNDYASGLTYYYFVSNMVTFAQQFIIRKMVDDDKLKAQIAENKKKPVKKSAFQARMEQVMKNSQAAQQQKANNKKLPPKKK